MNSLRVEEYLESEDSPHNANFNPYSTEYSDLPKTKKPNQKSKSKSTSMDLSREMHRTQYDKTRLQEEDMKSDQNGISSSENEEKLKLGNSTERTNYRPQSSKVSKMIADLTSHHNKRRANIVNYLAALNVEDAKSKFQKEVDDVRREYEYKIGMTARERDEWQWKVEVT